MPWRIVKKTGKRPYKIIKESTGKIVGSSESLKMAKASLRARYVKEKKS